MIIFADDENPEEESRAEWIAFTNSEEGKAAFEEAEKRDLLNEAINSPLDIKNKRFFERLEQENREAEMSEESQLRRQELDEAMHEDDDTFKNSFFAKNGCKQETPASSEEPCGRDGEIQENKYSNSLSAESIRRILKSDDKASSTSAEKASAYTVAQRLIRIEIIVCVGNGLYVFDARIYRLLNREQINRFIVEKCREAIEMVGEPAFIDKIYRFLFAEPSIFYKPQEPSPDLVVFKDGVLDTRKWTLMPHSPSIFATTLINVSYRRGELQRCPNFDAFLHDITGGDPVLTRRIWEVIGYLLTQDMRGKCFFIFQGLPDSGKSVLGNFIRNCFDVEMTTALDINEFSKDFALADIVGKRLCTDFDLPAGTLNPRAVSFTKKLTGSDPLSTNVKFMPRITFVNTAKLLFATNHPILTNSPDPAFLRRMVVVPFRYTIDRDKQDENLLSRLELERNDVAVKALRYYARLCANHYHFAGDFPPNQVCVGHCGDSEDLQSCIARFLVQECYLSPDVWTPTRLLYQTFLEQYPGSCAANTFSGAVESFCSQHYQGEVFKERHRFAGEQNPISGYKGLALKQNLAGVVDGKSFK